MTKRKKKLNTVKLVRCPCHDPNNLEVGCGMFFFDLRELLEHLDYDSHCEECGGPIGQSPKNDLTGHFCPSCRLEDYPWPKDRSRVC